MYIPSRPDIHIRRYSHAQPHPSPASIFLLHPPHTEPLWGIPSLSMASELISISTFVSYDGSIQNVMWREPIIQDFSRKRRHWAVRERAIQLTKFIIIGIIFVSQCWPNSRTVYQTSLYRAARQVRAFSYLSREYAPREVDLHSIFRILLRLRQRLTFPHSTDWPSSPCS